MSDNIIRFPKSVSKPTEAKEYPVVEHFTPVAGRWRNIVRLIFTGIIMVVWSLTVFIWPLLKWVVSIMTFFQFVRMLYFWNDPHVHAGWVFLAYFAVLTVLTYFVTIFRPKEF